MLQTVPARARRISPMARRILQAMLQRPPRRLRGKYIAIEVKSGDFFVGEDSLLAVKKGLSRFPKGFFEILRIGKPASLRRNRGNR